MNGLVKRTPALIKSWSFRHALIYYRLPALALEVMKYAMRGLSGLRKRDIQIEDHYWAYLEGGTGDPIVFVHGFGVDKDRFWTFLTGFSRSYRVIVPDLPGFGEGSRHLSASYDIPTQVKRLNGFFERIGLDSFHLFGVSLGGYISGYYASEYPEKVRSLALMDSAGVSSRTMSEALRLFEEEGEVVLLYRTEQEFERLVSLLFDDPPWMPRLLKRHLALLGAMDYKLHSKIVQDILDSGLYLLEERLSRISAETLVIWGGNDRLFDVSGVEKFAGRIPKNEIVIIDHCGHVPFLEKPKQAKQAYQRFLARRGAAEQGSKE